MIKILSILMLAFMLPTQPASADIVPIDTNAQYADPIGQHIQVLQEGESALSISDAQLAMTNGQFSPAGQTVLNYGIGAKPVWLAIEIVNAQRHPTTRRLQIEAPWLEQIDLYFLVQDSVVKHYPLGASLPYSARVNDDRFFVIDHEFTAQKTLLLIRIESQTAMLLPIYFLNNDSAFKRGLLQSFSYGFLYGAVVSLLLYNFILFLGIKSKSHLYYSIYLLFFLAVNIAYSGYGYQLLWPESTVWQLWSTPTLMIAFSVSGLIFAVNFLNIRSLSLPVYRCVIGLCVSAPVALLLTAIFNVHVVTQILAFSFMLIFSGVMILLGILSLYGGEKSARYFLAASISATLGSSITSLAVWGVIPFHTIAFRAVDIGMFSDIVLLALALTARFRDNQKEKLQAEKLARTDSLTRLNNRRAFFELIDPVWKAGIRNNHDMSVIILDIDHFKAINDQFGHQQGDQVIIKVADTMLNTVRASDICARWGGEEFLIFLPESNLEAATLVAEKLRINLAGQALHIDSYSIPYTASFGVASTRGGAVSLTNIIHSADQHLYTAKSLGRNRVYAGPAAPTKTEIITRI